MKKIITIIAAMTLIALISAYLLIRKSSEVKSTPTSTSEVLGENIAPSSTPIITPAPTVVSEISVKGYGEIDENGTKTTFVIGIPVSGGKVVGTINGYCEGNLEGVFDPRTDFIQGTMKGSCSKVPTTGEFKGKVNLKSKTGSGVYDGKSTILTKSGLWSLVIKP